VLLYYVIKISARMTTFGLNLRTGGVRLGGVAATLTFITLAQVEMRSLG